MLEVQDKQFSLAADGGICFQPDATNPVPGPSVGAVMKGESLLKPAIDLRETGFLPGLDETAARARVAEWLQTHINTVLEPLALLGDDAEIQAPARAIADKLYEALGILPRADLEADIAGLDEEGRRALRERKVRLGPVLVFLPLLNKPAAVRLRAQLWNLWHGKALPAITPPDGVTSISLAEKDSVDPLYYRAIGYPVYGPRAIRVDMLDRLIGAVYDIADKGVFKAQHDMAEWLGCPIADLYAVLEAMGHTKIHDPADEEKPDEVEVAEAPESPQVASAPATEETPAQPEAYSAAEQEPPKAQEKPELATFRLRKGKAYGGQQGSGERKAHKKPRKPHKAKGDKARGDKQKGGPRKHDKRRDRREEQGDRVIAEAPQKAAADSPFAVLKDLKVQGDGK